MVSTDIMVRTVRPCSALWRIAIRQLCKYTQHFHTEFHNSVPE